jgi:hypothetical protein
MDLKIYIYLQPSLWIVISILVEAPIAMHTKC